MTETTSDTPVESGTTENTSETAAPEAANTPEKSSDSSAENMVPSSRLREETGKRVRLERQLQQLQQQAAQQQQALEAAQKPTEPPPGKRFGDTYRQGLFLELGGDDEAEKAVNMMDEHAKNVASENNYMTQEQVVQTVQAAQAHGEQKQQAMLGVTNRLNELIKGGRISQAMGTEIHGKVVATIQENQQILQQPHNIGFLLDREIASAVERGEVQSFTPPVSPLQPSGRNGGPAPVEDTGDRSSSPLLALRGIDPEKIKAAGAMSRKNHEAATGVA